MNAIRTAIPEDFTSVRDLLADSALVHADLGPAQLGTFVVIPSPGQPPTVDGVAGVETFRDDVGEGLLRSVAVSPALRGQGIGASLVAAVEGHARTLGLRRLWLLATTAPDFFRRLRYTDAPRSQAPEGVRQSGEFKSLCPASAVCLSKQL